MCVGHRLSAPLWCEAPTNRTAVEALERDVAEPLRQHDIARLQAAREVIAPLLVGAVVLVRREMLVLGFLDARDEPAHGVPLGAHEPRRLDVLLGVIRVPAVELFR